MGRIDGPAPPRLPPRLPARRAAGAWKIVGGVLAVFVAFGAYKLVARGDAEQTGNRQAALATPTAEAITSSSNEAAHSERLARALTAIVGPPVSPAPGQRTFPPPVPRVEELDDKMARCLSLGIKTLSPAESTSFLHFTTQYRVSVVNRCDFSFEGGRVWFKVTVSHRFNLGVAAQQERDNFGDVTIDGGGQAEKVVTVNCACEEYYANVGLDRRP